MREGRAQLSASSHRDEVSNAGPGRIGLEENLLRDASSLRNRPSNDQEGK